MTIRHLSDQELLFVSGGQTPTPDAAISVNVEVPSGACRQIINQGDVVTICDEAITKGLDQARDVDGTLSNLLGLCSICAVALTYLSRRRGHREQWVPE